MSRENPHRITVFESLRGVLSFWVVFAHIGAFTTIDSEAPGPLRFIGVFNGTAGYAVNVFMILSGFVIFFLLDKGREGYFRFLFRRFFRLYPVFVAAFCLGLLVNPLQQYIHSHAPWSGSLWIQDQLKLAQNDARYRFQHILTHLPMLHGMVPENILPRTDAAFSGPGWSISTEWQFYLIAPLLFLLSRRLWGFILIFAVVLVAPKLPHLFPGINSGDPMRAFVLTNLQWFFVGIAFFHWYKNFAGFSPREALIRKIITGLTLIFIVAHDHYYYPVLLWLFFFGLVFLNRENPGGFAEHAVRFINARWLQYLGEISYPVYLLHWPILIVESWLLLAWKPQIDRLTAYPLLMIAVPLTTVVAAHFAHLWVELPGIQFARDFRPAKPAALTPPLDALASQTNEIQRKQP